MTIYVTPKGTATPCAWRARIAAEFEAPAVSLPVVPQKWTPPGSSGAPAVEIWL